MAGTGTGISGYDRSSSELPLVLERNAELPADLSGYAILVDKPVSWPSFRVVSELRRLSGIRKIGHAGTLDPMASGLLICCIGRTATKRLRRFVDMGKTYQGTMRLGEVTASFDAETPVTNRLPVPELSEDELNTIALRFTGELEQIPPVYSAIKVGGERLYHKARRGDVAIRPPRRIHVARFQIGHVSMPDVAFTVSCSKGTYVRSLAHDFGEALGCGAHLVQLRRTHIGPYAVDSAFSIDQLRQQMAAYAH